MIFQGGPDPLSPPPLDPHLYNNNLSNLSSIKKTAFTDEACIGGYPISHIPGSKRASIPYKLENIPIIKFPKYSISLKVTKILNTVSHIPESKMDSVLYPWK